MAAQSDSQHWHEIRQIQKDHIDFYKLLGVGLLILLGVWIGRATHPGRETDFDLNLMSEIFGIIVTVGIVEWFNQRRALRQYQQQLIDDAASSVNDVAKNAVYQILRKEWLEGEQGLLRGVNLDRANLQGAGLVEANLQGAKLREANLQGATMGFANLQGANLSLTNLQTANLWRANLQGASMSIANLQGAELRQANLQGAGLNEANLQGAELRQANLQGANLLSANLQSAYLSQAKLQGVCFIEANLQGVYLSYTEFDESTMLPDGSQWTPETDMRRFTDPEHPNFWRSDSPYSPAYRGKGADI